ncbi:MAG: ATP-binding protein, partial [Burkholderiales bacterium]
PGVADSSRITRPIYAGMGGRFRRNTHLGDPTLADAILDRLVHNSYRINLAGDSMRKRPAKNLTRTASATA